MLRDAERPEAPAHARIAAELRQCLQADLENYALEQQADLAAPGLGLFPLFVPAAPQPWQEAEDALRLLDQDLPAFLETFLNIGPVNLVGGTGEQKDGFIPLLSGSTAEKGLFSVTSR